MNRVYMTSEVLPPLSRNTVLHSTIKDISCETTNYIPCMDEFRMLMRCISSTKNPSSCHALYINLKSCLRVHGLNIWFHGSVRSILQKREWSPGGQIRRKENYFQYNWLCFQHLEDILQLHHIEIFIFQSD